MLQVGLWDKDPYQALKTVLVKKLQHKTGVLLIETTDGPSPEEYPSTICGPKVSINIAYLQWAT